MHDLVLVGDPHGQFKRLLKTLIHHPARAVVLLGDMDLEHPLQDELASIIPHTKVYWIHGNHDCDRKHWYSNLFDSTLGDYNLHGRVVDINGVRIAGLGGVFRQQIWHPETGVKWRSREDFLRAHPQLGEGGRLPIRHRASIWWEDYEHLFDLNADILVTHEAPSCNKHGFAVLDDLAHAMGVQHVFHGHHHTDYVDTICDGRVHVTGVGLAGIRALSGELLLPGMRSGYDRQ